MSTRREEDHLDPDNPMYYAPRRTREEANSRLSAFTDTRLSVASPSSFDNLFKDAVSRSLRTLDPVPMHEPPTGPGQWRELIPVAGRLAAAIGAAALAALFFVVMIPAAKDQASKDQAQNNNASPVAEAPKTAPELPKPLTETPKAISNTQVPREEESTPALAEFATVLAASRTAQPNGPAMTHEQSETLLQQFLRWQQKRDSTDPPSQ